MGVRQPMSEEQHSLEPLTNAARRQLAARANRLDASMTVGARGVTDAITAQVRQSLHKHELIKIRVRADKGDEADEVGQELARRVPCHVVQRVGKVVVLYAPKDPEAD